MQIWLGKNILGQRDNPVNEDEIDKILTTKFNNNPFLLP